MILLPAAYLLAQSGNVNLVWWAFPIAELVSVGATCIFLNEDQPEYREQDRTVTLPKKSRMRLILKIIITRDFFTCSFYSGLPVPY